MTQVFHKISTSTIDSILYFQVGPQAIYVVGRDDDDESIAAGSEVSDAASWETVNDDEMEVPEDSREVCFFFLLCCGY